MTSTAARSAVQLIVSVLCLAGGTNAAAWTDKDGVQHFTDDSVLCRSTKCLDKPDATCKDDVCSSPYMPEKYVFTSTKIDMKKINDVESGMLTYELGPEPVLSKTAIIVIIVGVVLIVICYVICSVCFLCVFLHRRQQQPMMMQPSYKGNIRA